jgi:hypothetical protein
MLSGRTLETAASSVLTAVFDALRLGDRPLLVVPTSGPVLRRNRYWSEGTEDVTHQARVEREISDALVERGCFSGALATVDVLAWDGSHVTLDHEDSANIAAVVVLFDATRDVFDVYELPLCRSSEGWQIKEAVRPLPTGPGEGVPGSVVFGELARALADADHSAGWVR